MSAGNGERGECREQMNAGCAGDAGNGAARGLPGAEGARGRPGLGSMEEVVDTGIFQLKALNVIRKKGEVCSIVWHFFIC